MHYLERIEQTKQTSSRTKLFKSLRAWKYFNFQETELYCNACSCAFGVECQCSGWIVAVIILLWYRFFFYILNKLKEAIVWHLQPLVRKCFVVESENNNDRF